MHRAGIGARANVQGGGCYRRRRTTYLRARPGTRRRPTIRVGPPPARFASRDPVKWVQIAGVAGCT